MYTQLNMITRFYLQNNFVRIIKMGIFSVTPLAILKAGVTNIAAFPDCCF